MNRFVFLISTIMIVFCANAENAHAQRRIRMPVLYGYGEECKEICELPPNVALASQLDQHGQLWRSSKIYSQIIDTLPSDDERLIYAKTCLDSINQRMAEQT